MGSRHAQELAPNGSPGNANGVKRIHGEDAWKPKKGKNFWAEDVKTCKSIPLDDLEWPAQRKKVLARGVQQNNITSAITTASIATDTKLVVEETPHLGNYLGPNVFPVFFKLLFRGFAIRVTVVTFWPRMPIPCKFATFNDFD